MSRFWGQGRKLPSSSASQNKFLHENPVAVDGVEWVDVASLPTQSGQNGKFLTTDGSAASWGTPGGGGGGGVSTNILEVDNTNIDVTTGTSLSMGSIGSQVGSNISYDPIADDTTINILAAGIYAVEVVTKYRQTDSTATNDGRLQVAWGSQGDFSSPSQGLIGTVTDPVFSTFSTIVTCSAPDTIQVFASPNTGAGHTVLDTLRVTVTQIGALS